MRVLVSATLAAATLAAVTPAAFAQQPPTRAIVNLTGQLYRAQNNNHYTVFLVTPEGVIMSDPINRDFALWLKAEFATRFKVPVRYVLYTHHDWDHASGGVVFADTAQFVGHVNMLAEVGGAAGQPSAAGGRAQTGCESQRPCGAYRGHGRHRGPVRAVRRQPRRHAERGRMARGPVNDVHLPTTTFTDRHTVTLGGKRVEMIHLGVAHTPDGAVLYFPDERTVFNADVMQVRRLPGDSRRRLAPGSRPCARLPRSTSIAATGHALAGTKKDALESLRYLEDLSKGVAAGVAAGRAWPRSRSR